MPPEFLQAFGCFSLTDINGSAKPSSEKMSFQSAQVATKHMISNKLINSSNVAFPFNFDFRTDIFDTPVSSNMSDLVVSFEYELVIWEVIFLSLASLNK